MDILENEVVLLVPKSFATGELGDPISPELQRLIRALAAADYVPWDFGEERDNGQELHFYRSGSLVPSEFSARELAEDFIAKGGDV